MNASTNTNPTQARSSTCPSASARCSSWSRPVSVDVDIANILGISVRTVRSYLDRIRDKTGERRRPGLTMIAIKKGLVPEPQEI